MIEIQKSSISFNRKSFDLFQKKIGYIFPQEYIEFLEKYNGGEIATNEVTPENFKFDSLTITHFFGIGLKSLFDITKQKSVFKNRIKKGYLPIADTEGGNLICLNLNIENYGYIYFWFHEDECLYFIAKSFEEFINMIKPYNYDDIEVVGTVECLNIEFAKKHGLRYEE